ncbi:MAG: bacillithiol biosynthesis BshC, partial [Thermoanaerobaculia bacterium]|nr:bacillithiol biosynthesis BshC [Thermoanaerobaculia bacterium]
MTPPDTPSSDPSRPDLRPPDLLELELLPALDAALLAGRADQLLSPLRLVAPGSAPEDSHPGGEPPAVDRGEIAAALRVTNDAYGHPRAAELASRLADAETRVVVTGQQPGLLGGPLYTLSKAVAAMRWAAELERRGHPAVAVFWMATEDHDFAEVAKIAVPGRDEVVELDLGEDPEPLVPVGMRTFGSAVVELLDGWRQAVYGDEYEAWIDRVATWYRPDGRFGEAFARLMVAMLGEHCPLLADSMLPEIKRAQRPSMRRLVEHRDELEAALAAADRAIEDAGHALQVRPQRDTSPLFLLHRGERRRIEWRGPEGFVLRGLDDFEGDVAELLETVDENPAVVSPGVLARPALQDAVFGTYLLLLGPGELAYLPQAAPVYRLLEIAPPAVALRPQALVLTRYERERLDELELALDDLVIGAVDPAAVVAEKAGEDFVAPVLERIEAELASLEGPALALDPNLESPLEKTLAHVRRGLETFNSKVEAAAKRHHETLARRV